MSVHTSAARRAGIAVAIAIGSALAAARPARACSCVAQPPAAILARDEVGVVAAVVSREQVFGYNHGYRLRIERPLKGGFERGEEVTVVLATSDGACGGDLAPGRTYAIFGGRGRCGELRVDPCQGSWLVHRDAAKELAGIGIHDLSPRLAPVRDFPVETLARCNPILGPRDVVATADILSLGEPDPTHHAEMPVRLRLVETNDEGDANGKLVAGQEIDVHAFFLALEPEKQTPATCFGPHNRPGQRVRVNLVVAPERINSVACSIVAQPDAGAAAPDASAPDASASPAARASRGCGCTAAPERGGPSALIAAALVALGAVRRRRRGARAR